MTSLDGFPSDLVSFDLQSSAVQLAVDSGVYPLEAVYGAAYIFIDRCYVFVDRPDAQHYRVTLTNKKGETAEAAFRTLVGEFGNELLSCAWRAKITQENRALIEAVTTQGLAGAMGPPSIDDLASFDFTEETFEDPLGIAMSWEEKYKKKDKPAASTEGGGGSTAAPTGTDAAAPAAEPKREAP